MKTKERGDRKSARQLRRERDAWKACARRAHAEIRRLRKAVYESRPEAGSDLARAVAVKFDFGLWGKRK